MVGTVGDLAGARGGLSWVSGSDGWLWVVLEPAQRDGMAAGAGFEKAQSLAAGIDAWSRSVDASVPMY